MSKTVELARHLETLHINNMYKSDFYWTWDKSDEEIDAVFTVADALRDLRERNKNTKIFNSGLGISIFRDNSTRTRFSFASACNLLGLEEQVLDEKKSQIAHGETVRETANMVSFMADVIGIRDDMFIGEGHKYQKTFMDALEEGYRDGILEQRPTLVNLQCDVDHPTQALADILTLMENTKKPLSKCKLVFCGDTRNNVAYCLMYICAKLGIHYVGWGPKELAPAADVVEYCREVAKETGAVVEYGEDRELIKGADALYTDIWASMGEEEKIPERVKLLTPYKVTGEVLKATENPDVLYLHCLPSFHDFETKMAKEWQAKGVDIREVTDEVFRSRHSVVFDEAENRMHSIKAVMVATIGA